MKMSCFMLIVSCLLFASCHRSAKVKLVDLSEGETSFRLDSRILLSVDYPESKDTIRLSHIADTVFYVSLESDNLKDILQIQYFDSMILVNDFNFIHLFDLLGKHLSKVPVKSGSFDVLPDLSRFYTYSFLSKEICSYDFMGNKIWQTKLKNDESGYYGYSFLAINDSLFVISNTNVGYNPDELLFVNQKGQVIHRIANSNRFSPPVNINSYKRGWRRSLFRACDGLRYHSFYSDTLFSVVNTNITPVVVETKIAKVPLEHRLEYTGEQISEFAKYCMRENKYATRFLDTSRYLIVDYQFGSLQSSLSNYLIFDKETGLLSRTYNNLNKGIEAGFLHFGISNDYDGGLAFEPMFQSGEYLIMVNAGDSQGALKNKPKQLYWEGRTIAEEHCECRSNSCLNPVYKAKTDQFFKEKVNDKDMLLMVVKLKSNSK